MLYLASAIEFVQRAVQLSYIGCPYFTKLYTSKCFVFMYYIIDMTFLKTF